jgi:methanogenic corrinoid protein MtbC1
MLDEKIIEEAKQLIVQQNKEEAAKLAQKFISEGGAPIELLNEGPNWPKRSYLKAALPLNY